MRGRFVCKSSGVLHHVSGPQYSPADRVVRRITMEDGRFWGSAPTASRRQTACTRKHSQPGLDRPRVAARDSGCGSVEPAVQLDFAFGTESRGRREGSRLRNPRGDTVR